MKYKILLLLFSLFTLMPGVNAKENYYDYEVIEIEVLPEASNETVDKLYKVDNKYYLGEKVSSDYTPIPLNEDLKGKTIFIDYKSITYEFIDSLYSSEKLVDGRDFVILNKNFTDTYNNVHYYFYKNLYSGIGEHYSLTIPSLNMVTKYDYISFLENGDYYKAYDSFVSNFSYSITEWLIPELEQYFSMTPFEVVYRFKEIPENLVVPPQLKEVDFYLFYTFDDISKFKALSLFDLTTFTDFEKVVTVLLINILFLGFLGFCCYILLKFIYKGISMLFR